MKRKVGEIFKLHNEWYQCIEGRCKDCYFSEKRFVCKQLITKYFCTSGIIFKKLEKVGESYTHYCPSGRIIYFQRYKLFYKLYSHNTEYIMCDFNEDGIVSIEIKQTKEDMEENKLNLKPFDIQKAREGKPVCTRDGRKARIICFDLNNDEYPIVVAITHNGEENEIYKYSIDGKFCTICTISELDLMMLPEKKEGWINVYKERIYSTKEEAIEATYDGVTYIDTIKISFEE